MVFLKEMPLSTMAAMATRFTTQMNLGSGQVGIGG
jgi:hypothetical protein